MIRSTKKVFLFLLDIFIVLITCFILIGPYIIVKCYKKVLVLFANFFLQQKLIQFDGAQGIDAWLLKSDSYKLLNQIHDNNYKNKSQEEDLNLNRNIGMLLAYEGNTISLEEIQAKFIEIFLKEENIIPSGKYNNLKVKIVAFGGYLFKERVKSINLNTLIYSVNLQDGVLEHFLADWFVKPFPNSDGLLWELISINENNNTGKSFLAFKIHHSLADGLTLAHMLDTFCGKDTKQATEVEKCVSYNLTTLIKAPRTLFNFHMRSYAASKLSWRELDNTDIETRVAYGTLNLNKIKEIRRQMCVPFQCILQTLVVGALRQLYLAKHAATGIPISASIFGMLPWPGHPYKERMANWMTPILLDAQLSSNVDDPFQRLLDIHKCYKDYHDQELHKIFIPGFGILIDLCPYFLLQRVKDMPVSTGWSSILLGNNYELFGQKIANIYPMGGIQGGGITLAGLSMSHSGQLDYTIIANKQFANQTELDYIAKTFIAEELNKLYKQSIVKND